MCGISDLVGVKDTERCHFSTWDSLVLFLPVACTHYRVAKTTRVGIGTGPSPILVVVL